MLISATPWPVRVHYPGGTRTEIMVTGTRASVLATAFLAEIALSTQGVAALAAAVSELATQLTVLAVELTALAAAVTGDADVSDTGGECSCFAQWLAQVATPWVCVGCWR